MLAALARCFVPSKREGHDRLCRGVRVASLPGIVGRVGLVVAVAGLGFLALGEGLDAISDNTGLCRA